MEKNVLLVYGHPAKESFNRALLDAYVKGAKHTDAKLQIINVRALKFAGLTNGKNQVMEPDIKKAQEAIAWADHLVFFYPTWWGGMPSLLKSFVERTFTSGFAYRFRKGSPMPEKLLTNKSARIITTMGAPAFAYRFFFGAPGDKMIAGVILKFCGVKPVRITHLGGVDNGNGAVLRKRYLQKIESLGRELR